MCVGHEEGLDEWGFKFCCGGSYVETLVKTGVKTHKNNDLIQGLRTMTQ